MLAARQRNLFCERGESEQDRMRRFLKRTETLESQVAEVKRTITNPVELERRLNRLMNEKTKNKYDLIMHLKKKFRHIKGMNPKTARF